MDAKTLQKTKTQDTMRGHPAFDAQIHDEAVETYMALSPRMYADHSTLLLNAPTPKDRLAISGAIRALGNSPALHYLAPAAVATTRLYHLVALLEGVVVPQLQVLVSLCDEQGLNAPPEARKHLSSALTFLAGPDAPVLRSAPTVRGEITWASSERIPQLRNSVAHFRFRLDEAVKPASDIPSVRALGRLQEVAFVALKGLAKTLRFPPFDPARIPNYENSGVHYEEDLKKPLLPTSRRRSYEDVRKILERVERLGMSMLFAFMDVGVIHQEAGRLQLGECVSCKIGLRSAAPGTTAPCPVCGASGVMP
jgi:hypothetical protein